MTGTTSQLSHGIIPRSLTITINNVQTIPDIPSLFLTTFSIRYGTKTQINIIRDTVGVAIVRIERNFADHDPIAGREQDHTDVFRNNGLSFQFNHGFVRSRGGFLRAIGGVLGEAILFGMNNDFARGANVMTVVTNGIINHESNLINRSIPVKDKSEIGFVTFTKLPSNIRSRVVEPTFLCFLDSISELSQSTDKPGVIGIG
mmetsp:Transcript_35928/g.43944  ORF Transcript_35928/g.43944 Transcript_35928/m.43944 type:complete len:202 (-) Transcript_35928:902-1507(-)